MTPTTAAITTTAGHGLLPLRRRGRLKNGARPGDFLAAPRCGARTRCGGACRQPAMKNGRCRMHGGLSTGPRTPEGRARCAAARRIHGGYDAATVKLLREAAAAARRLRSLVAGIGGRSTAGHGVLPSKQASRGRTGAQTKGSRGGATSSPNSSASLRLRGESSGRRPVSTAGHGVLPRRQSLMQRTLLGCTALGVSVRHPFAAPGTAGHGVLPPVVLPART